jgi:type II secretory pathway component PulM
MAAPADRYEPLPGLLGLPAHLLRKLSPRGRKVAAAVGVLLLAGGVALAIVLVPRITESKRENAAAERRAQHEAAVRQRARLIAEQRPRRGRVAPADAGASLAAVERAITRDARARAETGELDNVARRTECRHLGRDGGRVLLGCTAVTSEAQTTENVSGVVVGYSYRAAISPSGRFAFCKSSGRPAVGFEARGLPEVELPRACGG